MAWRVEVKSAAATRGCHSRREDTQMKRRTPTDAELKAKALSRWENEGGAIGRTDRQIAKSGPAARTAKNGTARAARAAQDRRQRRGSPA
jgi:hypothetical protein